MTAKDRYLEFLDALNRQDLEAAARRVETAERPIPGVCAHAVAR